MTVIPLNDPALAAYVLTMVGLLGLVMGSFINCWAWRYVNGESIVEGRSHCPACGHALAVRDLVPVFSWLASGRKCRYCAEPVSARYPATELVCCIAFVVITAVYGVSLETLELLAFAGVLLFLSLVDIDTRIIPNGCIVAALLVRTAYLGIAYASGKMDLADVGFYVASGLGMGVVLAIIILVADNILFKRESMGGGDLKLYVVAGFYFGWMQGIFLVFVSCIIGIAVALLTPAQAGAGDEGQDAPEGIMKRVIPFGPSIALACIVTMVAGEPFISWYSSLL